MKQICLIALAILAFAGCDRFVSPQTRVERAQKAMDAGDHRAAVVELMNALKAEPELEAARVLLAESALWLGDPRGAHRALQRVKSPPDAHRVLLEARIELALGRAGDAARLLQESKFAFSSGAREILLGTAYLQQRQLEEAEHAFAAALAADGNNLAARVGLQEVKAARGEWPEAVAALRALTTEHPDSAQTWMAYGTLLATGGDSLGATTALLKAESLAQRQLDVTRHAALLALLVDTQLLDGLVEDAARTGATLERIAPGSLVARYVSGRLAMVRNDYAAAVGHARKILEMAPKLLQARLLLSMALIAQGNLEQAGKELGSIVEEVPDNVVARQLLAQVRMRLDDPDGVLRMLVPALQDDAVNPQVNGLIDAASARLGATQTVSVLEKLLAQDPASDAVRSQLAAAYLQAGQAAKAAALLSEGGDSSSVKRAALLVQAIAESQGVAAAREQVVALVKAHPADAQLVTLAAAYYNRIGDATEARRVLRAAQERGGDIGRLLLATAQLEWSNGDREAADATVNRLLKLQPDNAAARMVAGEIALARGAFADARRHFESVPETRPGASYARLMLAQVALRQSDPAQADKWLSEAERLAPRSADVRNAAGHLNFNFGRPDAALEHFRAAVTLAPTDPVGWLNLARAQRALGQSGVARDSLQKALAARANWVPAVGALVALDIEERDLDAAHARVAALRAAEPRNPEVHQLEGDVHAATQKFSEASAAYRTAYDLAAIPAIAIKDYRVRAAGNLPQQAALLERWLSAHPEDRLARTLLAEAAMRRGDRAAAAEQYRHLLATRPNDVVAMNNLAWLYAELGDKRALSMARGAVRLAPQSAAVNDTLGWLLVRSGAVEEGVKYLRTAVTQKDADAEVHYHLAVGLQKIGAPAEAERVLETALRSPDFASRPSAEALLRQLAAGSADR